MGTHKSSFSQKVEWLVKNPEIVRTWPRMPWTDKQVYAAMRKAGLISYGAHDHDLGDLGKPVAEARAIINRINRTLGE